MSQAPAVSIVVSHDVEWGDSPSSFFGSAMNSKDEAG